MEKRGLWVVVVVILGAIFLANSFNGVSTTGKMSYVGGSAQFSSIGFAKQGIVV